jgi:hypothetical protein
VANSPRAAAAKASQPADAIAAQGQTSRRVADGETTVVATNHAAPALVMKRMREGEAGGMPGQQGCLLRR